jgi:hypothetical protein
MPVDIEATHIIFTWQARAHGDPLDIIEADMMTTFSLGLEEDA